MQFSIKDRGSPVLNALASDQLRDKVQWKDECPPRDKGIFVLSFDVELGWGHIVSGQWRDMERDGIFRKVEFFFKKLLAMLDEFEIPATFSFVANLLNNRTIDVSLFETTPYSEPIKNFISEAEVTSKCGLRLLEMIKADNVGHEIGFHSSFHLPFDSPHITQEMIELDVFSGVQTFSALNIDVQSFVFPGNREAYHHVLKNAGIKVYRGKDAAIFNQTQNRIFRRLLYQWEVFSPFSSPIVKPFWQDDKLLCLPGSQFFHLSGKKPLFLIRNLQRRIKSALYKIANSHNGICHIWLHPYNLAQKPGEIFTLQKLLHLVHRMQTQGRVAVKRMGDFSKYAELPGIQS